jgi:hypothetical protein
MLSNELKLYLVPIWNKPLSIEEKLLLKRQKIALIPVG